MTKQLENRINESIKQLEKWQTMPEFINVPPILWFGNVLSNKPKVLVISANPNKPDEPHKRPRLPYCKEWAKGGRDVNTLMVEYNEYFNSKRNPKTSWFGANPTTWKDDSQGHIEGFLSGLNASFYGGHKYQAIHIDLLPFATKGHFAAIADKLMAIPDMSEWVNQHLHSMIGLIKPKLIIVNGNTNFHYFNLMINLGAQPYKIHTLTNGCTLWQAARQPNRPPIIGISMNLGSRCCMAWHELQVLGKEVVEKTDISI